MNDLDHLVQAAQADFDAAPTPAELENAKARFLGKSGRVTELLKGLAALARPKRRRPAAPRSTRPSSASRPR
jgi:phenylalanyl-tRNA synthetase alpha chain